MNTSREVSSKTELEQAKVAQCGICSTLRFNPDHHPSSRYSLYRLLLEDCSACSGPSPISDNAQLCAFCRHLRPEHMIKCDSPRQSPFERRGRCGCTTTYELRIELGSFAELRARPDCAFCRFVAHAVGVHFDVRGGPKRFPSMNFALLVLDLCPVNLKGFRHGYEASITCDLLPGKVGIRVKDLHDSGTKRPPEGKKRSRKSGRPPPPIHAWPLVEPLISWDRVREMMAECLSEHSQCEPAPVGVLPSEFRLIDVKARRLVHAGSAFQHPFVALSYVWGKPSKPTSGGQSALLKDETLANLLQTIDDALTICTLLDHSYLWVDRLCTTQNANASASAIYTSATLVLVASNSPTAHAGIAGLTSSPRPCSQTQESFRGHQYTSALPSFRASVRRSAWSKHEWTYMEAVVAKRVLYFSAVEVWFSCEVEDKREDLFFPRKMDGDGSVQRRQTLGYRLLGCRRGGGLLGGASGGGRWGGNGV